MESYEGRAALVNVYIKEAHPTDGWKVEENDSLGICYLQPRSLAARTKVAKQFIADLAVSSTFVVDGMDDAAMHAFAALPERIFGTPGGRRGSSSGSNLTAPVVEDGKVAYRGGLGPFQYSVNDLARWLSERFGEEEVAHSAPM
mmetsp:Transcript_12591/g.50358  ORF Transcript_12591/g.50358 Transcript_12591/m.50358 type:complete len:144 (+) Transcript_12591:367-798(+)